MAKKKLNSLDKEMRTKITKVSSKGGITPLRSVQAASNWLHKKGYVKATNKKVTNE